MSNYLKTQKQNNNLTTADIQQFMLGVFVFLAPIYKCLDGFSVFGYNVITIAIIVMLLSFTLNIPRIIKTRQKLFFAPLGLAVLCIELAVADSEASIGMVLALIMFSFFLTTDKDVKIERLYYSFFAASVLAAVFSLYYGLLGGSVNRVAVIIDGSIAPICIAIALFVNEGKLNVNETKWNVMKIMSILSSFLIIVFGMSRSRSILVVFLFALSFLYKIYKLFVNKSKISFATIFTFIVAFILILVFLILPVSDFLLEPLMERFENGLVSMGRDIELQLGLDLFRENKILGAGWGNIKYTNEGGSIVSYDNHCAYVAVLARGGILMGLAIVIPILILLKRSVSLIKNKPLAFVLMMVLLILSYGNAGIFNYTICSIIPLVVLYIKRGSSDGN